MTTRTDLDRAHDRAYDRHRRRRIKEGTWQHPVPAATIRRHLTLLSAAGMSLNAIAAAAQLSPGTVWPAARSGQLRYVQGATAAAILAVVPPDKPPLPAGMTDATGTARRLQALVAIGYSISDLSRRLGHKGMQQVWEWTRRRQSTLTEVSAAKVTDLYEKLSGTPGPSIRARNDARRNEWLPPLAWDDVDIDDPAAEPDVDGDGPVVDEFAIELVLAGERRFSQLQPNEKLAVFRDYTAGWSPARVGRTLNMSTTSVGAWRAKAGVTSTSEIEEAA